MRTFMAPNISNINIPKQKIKLRKGDVKLVPIISKDLGKIYKMKFMLNIYMQDPNIKLTPRNVDMISLKNAIINNLTQYDQKYMKLSYFDTKKAEFVFDLDKWMRDATNNLHSKTEMSKFSRSFKLKVAPPRIIMEDMSNEYWGEYILRHFRKYVDERKKGKEFFRYLLPKDMLYKLNNKTANMFDWHYDIQWNKITATLKSQWILAILYATSKAYNGIKNKESFFNAKVNKNLSQFKKIDFTKYINKNKVF